jgi:hypothetical protein
MPALGWDLALWAFVIGFFGALGWGLASWLLGKVFQGAERIGTKQP